MKRRLLAVHVIRTGSLIVLLAASSNALVQAAAMVMLYLSSFLATHDLAHGALGLPRRLNELLLGVFGLPMMISGHAMRLMHMRHHARPLAADDLEGRGAALPFLAALLEGPSNAFAMRRDSWFARNRKERRTLRLETVCSVLLAALACSSQAGRLWVSVCIVFQLTATAWASHLPHHPPVFMQRIARALQFLQSSMLKSFLFHDEHHAHPKVPCALLAQSLSGAQK